MSRRLDLVLIDGLTSSTMTAAQLAAATVGISPAAQLTEMAFYIEFDHTSAAGVVLIETASDPNYAGTWAVLATITWSAIDKCHYVAITGAVRAIRARISTTVTSGTVAVRMVGNIGS